MRSLPLLVALAALAAGCTSADEPTTPTPGETNPEAIAPPVDVLVSLFDRTPGVGLPPSTMGIDPPQLDLSLNVPVNLTVLNDGSSTHNWHVHFGEADEDAIMSDDLDAGASQSILFTPTIEGEFEMYCSIGGDGPLGHRAQGMRGTVTVA